MKRVYCATIGCDKNLVDSEALLGRFAGRGIQGVQDPAEADIWILNSCGFIEAARHDSEQTLQSFCRAKDEQTLVVCGCWSQEHAESIRERYPEVDVVAGVGQFDEVVSACLDEKSAKEEAASRIEQPFPMAGNVPIVGDPMTAPYPGLVGRPLLTPPHVAFVKIGEGCNCSCTFCRIPLIRGKLRSRPIEEILLEVQGMVASGVTEIQLVSQNTSDFGRDTGQNLKDLVAALDQVDGLRRMRLFYLYPGMVSVDDLLRLLEYDKVVKYLELPVQHASPRILKAMRRPGGFKSSPEFYGSLRREHPDLVLRSTALLGFPGEEEEDVALLADFLAAVEFDHLGTYRYSPEPGTGAYGMPDPVPDEEILDREALIIDLQQEISQRRMAARLGQKYELVVDRVLDPDDGADGDIAAVAESLDEGQWVDPREREALKGVGESGVSLAIGRSYHFGYDLDGVVLLPGTELRAGQWIQAEFRGATAFDVWATPAD